MSARVHIGELRERMVLEAPSRESDGGGGASVTWDEAAVLWAKLTPRSGAESLAHDRVSGSVSHEIVVRYREDITPARRLRLGPRVFDIRSAFDPDGRRQWLVCAAEERGL